jgi:hypothetical protein
MRSPTVTFVRRSKPGPEYRSVWRPLFRWHSYRRAKMRSLASAYGKIAIALTLLGFKIPLLSAQLTTGPVQERLKQSLHAAPL